ncbi:MAG TPA: beta-propeller domain-containing protein [Nocardioidaceae bacterium]|nr:beta-propeller domain-containing protein [Nocardioidaceae bacterium]
MGKLAFGAALAATTACLSVAVNGIAGSTGSPLGLPRAAAGELPAFADCAELRDWYVDQALPQVGPWGFGYGGPMYYATEGLRVLSSGDASMGIPQTSGGLPLAEAADGAVTNGGTGTNVQEIGIDEPDVAKTDGRLVFRLDERELVVTDVSGAEPRELSRTKLPDDFAAQGLLLVGDTVLVTASGYGGYGGGMPRIMIDSIYVAGPVNSKLAVYDVSVPRDPELVSEHEYEGTLVETRQYGDLVRLVVQTGLPQLDFVQPGRRRSDEEATRENREIVRSSTIEDWLPFVRHDGRRSTLLDCQDVRHPRLDAGFGTISVVTFRADDPGDDTSVGVATSGSLAYSSTDRLYVATPVQPEVQSYEDMMRGVAPEEWPDETMVHAFELTDDGTAYLASGKVEGTIRDRWSFDEQDGYLRVATAHHDKWATTDNAVTVLREDGSTLRVVGNVRGLGPREEIQSVRWFEDFAVVVTFRQVDPLYTVDLTDPSRPRVLGELKIPGFSSYLHPLGDRLLLGLGTAADLQGRTHGSQAAIFDLSTLRDPQQISLLKLPEIDELAARYDPHAFTFTGKHVYTLAHSWNRRGSTSILKLSVDGGLREVASYEAGYDARVLPIDGGRVALVGDAIRLLAD